MGGRGALGGGGGGNNGKGGKYIQTFTDGETGGKVYTEHGRIDLANKSGGEMDKYVKEKRVCETLARNGHTIVHLDDTKHTDGTYDILLDGVKGDIKCLSSSNNIMREGNKAVRKQGASIVVFEFERIDTKVHREINKLSDSGIHGFYFLKGTKQIQGF